MKKVNLLLAGIAGIALTSGAFAGANESANLSVSIGAGALEIVATSIDGTHTPTSGSVTATSSIQTDAITFAIDGITLNDLNGDGLGWRLTASPGNLTFGSSTLSVGTTAGFNNPSDAPNTTVDNANQITYTETAGVSGYTLDYDIAYTVPAFAEAGTYTGSIAFSVVAN